MDNDLFRGNLVRLTLESPEAEVPNVVRWWQDSEYMRLLDNDPARLWSQKKIREWIDKDLEEENPSVFFFHVHTLQDDRPIGFVGLFNISWTNGDAWVGIGMGARDTWGRGYGTDAMRLALRYAFTELNLRRVSLGVFEYNRRAIRSYMKAGFTHEGRLRQALQREGRRWDLYLMGLLKSEWQAQQDRTQAETSERAI